MRNKLLQSLIIVILSLGASAARAQLQIYTEFDDFSFGTWNGQGDVSTSATGCVANFFTILFFPFPATATYQLRLQSRPPAPSGSTPFRFYNTDNSSYWFPATITATDHHGGGLMQWLDAGTWSDNLFYEPRCETSVNNVELTFSALAADMYQVPAGSYELRLDVNARRISSGSGASTDTQTDLRGSIDIPALVQISGLNDINLGTYDGVAASLTYNESYCVYSNTPNYRVTPSSPTVGNSAGSFAVASGTDLLEYTVRVNNSADASGGFLLDNNEESPVMASNQSFPFSVNCSGGDNAAIYLEFSGPDMQGVLPGNYSGVLHLLVAPI